MEKRAVEVVVISDVHLGTFGCHAKELYHYLCSISPQTLILNGDFIDGWQFNKRYFPAMHMQVIKEIMDLATRGTRVIYITGNHDEMLRKYSDIQFGNFQLADKLVMEINGKKTWIFHGDVFDATTKGGAKLIAKLGGFGYDLLILLNSSINSCLSVLGRDKMSFSKRIKNSVKKAVSWIDNFERTAAELAIAQQYDYVICGHIHQPQKRLVKNSSGEVMYLNSGDWIENLSALEYSNNDWHIYHYDKNDFISFKQKFTKRKTVPEVVTNEIDMYITSLTEHPLTENINYQ